MFFSKIMMALRFVFRSQGRLTNVCHLHTKGDWLLNNGFLPGHPSEIAKALGINECQLEKLVQDYPEVADCQRDQLLHKFKLLIGSNIFDIVKSESHFKSLVVHNHPWLLLFRPTLLSSRIKWYKKAFDCRKVKYQTEESPQVIPLLFSFPLKQSRHYLIIYDTDPMSSSLQFLDVWQERLFFLSEHLEVTRFEVISIAKTLHPSILTREFSVIKEMVLLLKDSGLTASDLLNDLHVFRHSLDMMKERIEELKKVNALHTLRTWMLRAPDKTIVTSYKIREMESKIIGRDRIKYLSEKLNVKREEVESVVSKNPFILGVKAEKLEKLITLLMDFGYNGWEILHCPRCFQYSLDVLKKRHGELASFWKKPPFNYLSLDDKKYLTVFQRACQLEDTKDISGQQHSSS